MPIMAVKMARGTVRAGSRTSPLGTSALSMPLKAKMRRMDVRVRVPADGTSAMARFSPLMKNTPTATSSSNGASLAAVAMVFNRLPYRTPMIFTPPVSAKAVMSTSARSSGEAKAGMSAATLSANTPLTAATAVVPSSQSMTPARKPMYGPKASST